MSEPPTTVSDALAAFAEQGHVVNMIARPEAQVLCTGCRTLSPAADMHVVAIVRTEGASDPDDMTAVVAVVCPAQGEKGSLVLAYGPESSIEDSEVLAALEDSRAGTDHSGH